MGNIMDDSKKIEFINLKKINIFDTASPIIKNKPATSDNKLNSKVNLDKFEIKDIKKKIDFKGFVHLKKVNNKDFKKETELDLKKKSNVSSKENSNKILNKTSKNVVSKKDYSKAFETNSHISKLTDKALTDKALNKELIIQEISASNIEEKNINDLLLELENKTQHLEKNNDFIESFSFLDDVPSVQKISYDSYKSNNLFSKLDEISKSNKDKDNLKNNKPEYDNFENISFEDSNFEKLIIPDIIALKDDSKGNSNQDEFISFENSSKEKQVNEPIFLDSKNGLSLNSNLEEGALQVDKLVKNKNKSKNDSQFKREEIIAKANEDDNFTKDVLSPNFIYKSNLNSEKEVQIPSNKINSEKDNSYNSSKNNPSNNDLDLKKEDSNIINKNENLENLSKKYSKKIYDNQNSNTEKESKIQFLFPKDRNTAKYILPDEKVFNSKLSKYSQNEHKYPSLVYSVDIEKLEHDKENIFSKYNIDEFTYITIYFEKEKNELIYNIVQPELSKDQSKEYLEIKKTFFNTIDKSYYYFNGDKYNVDQYISKIYDLTLDKLSYSLDSLKKKLYLKFIVREFSGLGFLTNLLLDKKILEVSCAGENSNISVYHIDYGVLNTNLKFNSIFELNQFVITLTKNMGLFINSTNPVINGYLPNGYKVEGLYSVGDTSSKGSSFVIKKYLDQPLTPISLIKTSIGVIDVFSYIWSAISQGYKIILSGKDDSYTIFNSIALFLPNKKIISIQAYDRLKLPQKEWVKKTFTGNDKISKKELIEQTLSQRPDYTIVDEFDNSMFDLAWYNLDLFTIDKKILSKLQSNLKLINLNAIIIDLKKLKYGLKEGIQITDIYEYSDKKETKIIEFDEINNNYHINLLSSQIDIVEFTKKKKMLRWMKDSKIYNYKDFNNICSQYMLDKNKIIKRLGIKL